MKILLAEDDAVTRYILQEMLQVFGYEVTACENGRLAWEAFCDGDFPLVISDWLMPEMDGVELCRRIRHSDKTRSCYFMLQTSNHENLASLDGLPWAADSYLPKSFDGAELRARLKTAEKVLALESRVQALLDLMRRCSSCKTSLGDDELSQAVALGASSGLSLAPQPNN